MNRFLAIALALIFTATAADAGVIILTDGSHLVGTIVEAPAAGPVVLVDAAGGHLSVPRDEIEHLLLTPADPASNPGDEPFPPPADLESRLEVALQADWRVVNESRQAVQRAFDYLRTQGSQASAEAQQHLRSGDELRDFAQGVTRYPPLAMEILADAAYRFSQARREAGSDALAYRLGQVHIDQLQAQAAELEQRLTHLQEEYSFVDAHRGRDTLDHDGGQFITSVEETLSELQSAAGLAGERAGDLRPRVAETYTPVRNALSEIRQRVQQVQLAARSVEPGLAAAPTSLRIGLSLRVPAGWPQDASTPGIVLFKSPRQDDGFEHLFNIAKIEGAATRSDLQNSAVELLGRARGYTLTSRGAEDLTVAGAAEAFRIRGTLRRANGVTYDHTQIVIRVGTAGVDPRGRVYVINFFAVANGQASDNYQALYQQIIDSISVQ